MFTLIDQRIYVIVDAKMGFIVSIACYTGYVLWGIKMARGRRNEFTGNGTISCGAAVLNNIEKRIAGLDDRVIDDMRKDACKRCKYHDTYPRCNYANMIDDENRGLLLYGADVRWLEEGELPGWIIQS